MIKDLAFWIAVILIGIFLLWLETTYPSTRKHAQLYVGAAGTIIIGAIGLLKSVWTRGKS